MNTHERELLYFSMEKLKALTGADARDLSLLATNDYNPDYRDGTIEIKMGKHLDRFDVVLKNQVRDAIPSYLLQPGYNWKLPVIALSKRTTSIFISMTSRLLMYVYPQMASFGKQQGSSFSFPYSATRNCSIRTTGLSQVPQLLHWVISVR
jgi:hypothetical protein